MNKEAQIEGIKGKKENQHIIISRKIQKKGIRLWKAQKLKIEQFNYLKVIKWEW